MADRTIVTRMRVEYKQAVDGMNAVGSAAINASNRIEGAGKKSDTAFSKMAQQATENRQAWETAGAALTIVGGAITGVGAAAAKTGVEYNTLQQTSRAAMKTLMGGAEQANAQMDKLDKFAKTSPFAKQVFISAQQQLVGFGVEAKKVIPYLEAIQDAVAATGGSNEDISGLVATMSKIQSSAKVTAEDLNEFGNRGVDAAGLIGSQMGKTGAEIRSQITDGALGAEEALDALTKGMSEKFDGAAAGVKQTMTGAMDRVKSAWRDVSAALVEPFVSANGGGVAVDWLNAIADKMRAFEGLEGPVKGTALALGGIVGAGSLAAGGFLALAPRIVETQAAFKTLAGQGGLVGKTASAIGGLGPVLGAATVAWLAFESANVLANRATKASIPSVEKITSELGEMAKKGGELNGAFGGSNAFFDWMGHSQSVNDMGDAFEVIGRHAESGTLGIAKFREAITPGAQELERATEGVKAYDEGLASLVNDGKLDQAQDAFSNIAKSIPEGMPQSEVMERFSAYREALQGTANDLDVTSLKEKDYYEWMRGNVPAAIQEAVAAQEQAANGYTGMSEAAIAAKEHLEEVRTGLIDGANGFVDFTEKAKESKTTLEAWISDMEKQVAAQATWMDNLGRLAERGAPQALLDQLLALGPEGAAMVKKLADGSDADMQRVIDVFNESGRNVTAFGNKVAGIPPIDLDADATKLKGQVKTAEERLDELRKLPTTPEIDAQITLLEDQVKAARSKLKEVEREKTTAKVDADTSKAKEDVRGFKAWFKENSTVTMTVIQNIKEVFDPKVPNQGGKKDRKGNNSRSPMARATGGSITGPGTGTSDSIPAMLSNGEHVWTAEEVRKAGGHGAIEAMRAAVKSGNAFAGGGAVGSAERRLADAQRQLDSISRRGQKRTPEDVRRDAAQKRVDRARANLDRAKDAAARRERVAALQDDFKTDLRRGSLRDQVTGSLSGGFSAVDRLAGLGSDENLSRGSRSKASSSARKFEANLKNLYAQADSIDEKLKSAQDKAQELKGIKDSVVNSLLGGRDLDVGTFQTQKNGQWESHSNLGQAAKGLRVDVGAMKAFAGKLKKLTELGVPGSIIQEIAQAGVSEGSNMADSFIDATAAERKSYMGAWSDYEKYANQAGQYVTEGFQAGGASAADGVVKGLEGKKKSVESAIANLAKAMESTFKQVLGIHSPSRVMSELGGFTAEGLVQGMLGGAAGVQSAADVLAQSAMPNMMAFDVTATPVVEDDEGMAGLAMQDMSTTTLEAMQLMQQGVSDGWAAMLLNTQEMQAGLLLGTQTNNAAMSLNTSETMAAMLLNLQTQQSAMLLDMQTKQASMLLGTQTQYEAMRLTTEQKQIAQKTVMTDQQEAMRLMLIDKQASMLLRSSTDFESMKKTTGTKFGDMRSATDTTMGDMYSDYDTRLGSLKGLNKRGFESILATSNANMKGVRDGIDAEMRDARPELGNRMNALIGVLGSFTESVNKAFGDVGVKLKSPKSLSFATGGVLPGYTPGRDIHEFYSPSAGYLNLSGGEAIMRPEFVKAVGGKSGIDRLNKSASGGHLHDDVDHFASGGVIPEFSFASGGTLMDAANWWVRKGARGSRHPAFGGPVRSGHSRGSLHYQDKAVDFNYGPGGTNAIEQAFFDKWVREFKGNFPGIRTIWRAPGHYNHLHIDTSNGADIGNFSGAGGGGFSMPHPFLDDAGVTAGGDMEAAYGKAAKKYTQQIYAKHAKDLPGGIGGQLGKGVMSQVSEGLIKKAKEYGKGSADFSNVANGPVRQMAKQMNAAMGWGDQWGDLDWLVNKESSWNPNAQNPSSTAYGLFQFLNGTWDDVGGTKTSDPKKQIEYGLKYIKQRYNDPRGARAHHRRANWYEDGVQAAKSGWAVVGEAGPEAIELKGGERVKNAQETRKLLAENRTFIPNSGGGFNADAIGSALASHIQSNGIGANDLANALNGVRLTFQADGQQFTGAVTAVVGNGYDESRSRLSKSSQKIGAR